MFSTDGGKEVDATARAIRAQGLTASWNGTRYVFVFGNSATLAVIVFGDLAETAKLAVAAIVVLHNLGNLLAFNTNIMSFKAAAVDTTENSDYSNRARTAPWGIYSALTLSICALTAVAQVALLYAS